MSVQLGARRNHRNDAWKEARAETAYMEPADLFRITQTTITARIPKNVTAPRGSMSVHGTSQVPW